MFGRYIDGGGEEWCLPCHACDVWYTSWFLLREEMRDGHLGDADWVCEVYVEEGVPGCGGVVFRRWGTWRMPEVGEGLGGEVLAIHI